MKKPVVGILAHVDAGKTTLSEAMLYESGMIRRLGRVDHQDAYLDTFGLERARGITIFSKQARVSLKDCEMMLLDTPGHVDFSAETERTLQVLDYAILVISAVDGVQSHTQTLWKLLTEYHIPVFLFVNKMDLAGEDFFASRSGELIAQMQDRLGDGIVDFTGASYGGNIRDGFAQGRLPQDAYEAISLCDEKVMEEYLATESISDESLAVLIAERKLFPCFFGSALKLSGVRELLEGIRRLVCDLEYPAEFGAKVYKIARDTQGNRLTYLKLTGGVLKVKGMLNGEKVDQIRLYSGEKYEPAGEVYAGSICAVTGPVTTYPGQGIGIEEETDKPLLAPVMTYQVVLPEGVDALGMLDKMKELEEEEPALHVGWKQATGEIYVQIMGSVQLEILKELIKERFQVEVSFGRGSIVYQETIAEPVVGIGHFEPLRHYAEVHILMEPLPRGTGLIFDSQVPSDVLDLNWQRLIMTHMAECEHPGVLTGAALTDVRMTLVAGRAHQKHTEGGDFRQATYRAIRQGLKQAKSILLEPYYHYTLRVPGEQIGRAMNDITGRGGSFEPPLSEGEFSVLTGRVPAAAFLDYMSEVAAYTKGQGSLQLETDGYDVCHNADEVLQETAYDSEQDLDRPTGSVFCTHGAGFYVPWDEVERYAHLQSRQKGDLQSPQQEEIRHRVFESDDLETIMQREFGTSKRWEHGSSHTRYVSGGKTVDSGEYYRKYQNKQVKPMENYLLVDGYNIIFAWQELKELAKTNLDAARGRLMDILCDYQGYTKCHLILVFDAYKVKGNPGSVGKYHNIHVVYTKEAETADMYIEKVTKDIGKQYHVRVATSDGLEQLIIMGHGAMRVSAAEFEQEVAQVKEKVRTIIENRS